MQETHNIRIETTLKDRIRINGERNGNAWTKQMRLDLESLYAVDPYKASPYGEPAYITSLRLLAESLGMSTYELCSLIESVVRGIRGAKASLVITPPVTTQEAPQSSHISAPTPSPWEREGVEPMSRADQILAEAKNSVPGKFPTFNFAQE